MAAISKRMSEAKKANANFAQTHLAQVKRVLGVMQIHLSGAHPGAARNLNRAWAAVDAAEKDLNDSVKEESPGVGPQLGFSGAQIGPTQANPIPGNQGGGMGTPT